ncbi:diguanylate cyclase domain-containing protein [Blastococcus sp. LR1]|uniref:diguanylate cyclase domain-containing protein n=1 Tax=Blastococcus sp. LR1 TaxID=2877000 RepID=UPI001CCF116B|nr:diguanylate cyclase [Blastococcus sp. LR1]MCA0145402.1 diguanylate cyclase [Blastococcus sp. LR1]
MPSTGAACRRPRQTAHARRLRGRVRDVTSTASSRWTIRTLYQPIVDLRDGSLVAVEALSRGEPGPRESAQALFASARASGTLTELDEGCLHAALHGAGRSPGPVTLFVNIEAVTLSALTPRRLAEWADLAAEHVRVVVEVTERDLLENAAELVRGVHAVRDLGWDVALDDAGAEPKGLALMPFLRPDVIKLDLALVRGHTTLQTAAVVNAVRAEAERSGAILLAEGIENEQHLERALAMGARLGQGWMFGRPGPLATEGMSALPVPPPPPARGGHAGAGARTPYEMLTATSAAQRATVPLVASMTRQLERQALLLDDQTVVLANFQDAAAMTPATRRRYESLASLSALTAVTGAGMPDEPAPGVHGTALESGDPLTEQWVITVVSPHFAAALVARDVTAECGDEPVRAHGPVGHSTRRLDYVLTYDRQRVLEVAGLVLSKVRAMSAAAPARPPARSTQTPRAVGVPPAVLPDLLLRAISTASNGIVIADATQPDLPLVYVNAAFLRLTGYSADEVLGRNCRFLQGPATDPTQVQPISRRLLAGRDVHTVLLNYRRDGSAFWNELHISPVTDAAGDITHYIGNQLDVSSRVERERRTTYLAHHDELTALPNRAHTLDHLRLELRRARRNGGSVAVVMLDLDQFKEINDRFGHAAGDSALRWAARRLRSAIRAGDLLGRLGGDEFLVVLAGLPPTTGPLESPGPSADETLRRVQEHIHAALDRPLALAHAEVRLSASSGAALFPRDAAEAAELIAHADAAMYLDKSGG